jgi:hypothetical protein
MIGPCDIEFDVRELPGGELEVVPRIAGHRLTDLIDAYESRPGRHAGLRPASHPFGALDRHFRGGTTETFAAGATPVLGGDRPVRCRITVTDDWVVWDEFSSGGRRLDGVGPFGFTRAAYEDALGDLALALA